jgi:hypothetical protein
MEAGLHLSVGHPKELVGLCARAMTRWTRGRWIGRIGLIGVLVAPLHVAVGQTKLVDHEMEVKKVNGQLEISVTFPEIFTTKLRERLSSGFTNRILIGVQLVSSKDGSSVAQGIAEYIIIYDIWEEHYVIRELWPKMISEPLSFEKLMAQYRVMDRKPEYRNTQQVSSLANLIKICGSLRHLPLSWRSEPQPDTKLTAYVRVEINPLSGEQMGKVREYLANPDGPTREKTIFFAPTFVNWKNFQADAVVTYQSPKFTMR